MDRLCRVVLIVTVVLLGYSIAAFVARNPALAVVAVGLLLYSRVRAKLPTSDLHGTARWCTEDDARHGGLL